jgi:hypothetical protein
MFEGFWRRSSRTVAEMRPLSLCTILTRSTWVVFCLAVSSYSPKAMPQSASSATKLSQQESGTGKTASRPRAVTPRVLGVTGTPADLSNLTPLVYLPCGTYSVNLVITQSNIRILGVERGCVQLVPANPALPVVTIDATNSGSTGIGYDEVSDLTIACPAGMTCSDGLKIMGQTNIYQPNDWHKFSRLGIYGAFQNGINLAGRTIWTEFDNVEVESTAGNGINIVSNDTTNQLTFRNVRSAKNFGYGIYVNNTQKDLANGILFDKVNAEYNGLNTALASCAGIYLTGVSQATITNSYFEGNCQNNTADNTLAEVRLTGTYNQSVSILNSVFNLQFTENGIYNDTLQTTGTYDGNKFTGSGVNGLTIYVATAHPMSQILIGDNFSSTPTIVPDLNGISHVRTLSAFGLDYNAITSVSNGTIDVGAKNAAILYYGPYVINNLINGTLGQIVSLLALRTSGHVLTNSAGGAGQIVFPDGQNRTLNAGESLLLYFDGSNWRPIEGNITTQPRYVGTIFTESEPPPGQRGLIPVLDSISVPGITAQSHCYYSPNNQIAGAMNGSFITTGAGQVTLSHEAVQGGIFSIFCSAN